jgi:flagellar assembly protein FliH
MATSPLIPKEQLSAYQRWELGSFDRPIEEPVNIPPSPERVRQMDQAAREEGFAAGHREGLEAARRDALVETTARLARLDQMVTELATDLSRVEQELANEVVQLGLAVARKLVGEALRIRPDIVRHTVEEALRQVAQMHGPLVLIVNPEDAPIVRSFLQSSPPRDKWSLREDPAIACGGCRLETLAGEVDATLDKRWHRVTGALGNPSDWIE